jgi:hypothetical protein
MGVEPRRQLLLGAVVAGLAFTIYHVWPSPAGVAPVASSKGRRPTTGGPGGPPGSTAPDVHLDALEGGRPKPVATERDLFRFKPKPPPPPPPPRTTKPAETPVPTGPPPPPPLPPIALKFIGVLEAPERPGRIAILSDGRDVFHGREGDIIEGRYRILKIGAESIDMAYLDGRGRQTIRLSGQ